ncbi:hypothetical protein AVEN_260295-1 [Araneus ventricosus]|uniref:Uncharacterized protein n=1 Tax=Araneus ventricosus TaxID=182803 RepID=A0A4Y2J1M3_ARAVE|nr:hypothetical protein AVEN_260295-1 [Araneus ventricosus]
METRHGNVENKDRQKQKCCKVLEEADVRSSDALGRVYIVHPIHRRISKKLDLSLSFQLNTNFTCGDPMILLYELIHSRNRGTVGHNVLLPRARQVLDVYPPHNPDTTGIWLPLSSYDKFVKYSTLLREEIE